MRNSWDGAYVGAGVAVSTSEYVIDAVGRGAADADGDGVDPSGAADASGLTVTIGCGDGALSDCD
jgi:hypothetical protein